MNSTSQKAEEIQREMARIRCDLNEDVDMIVGDARVMSDWRYYVKTYPWACAAGAVALGYLIVPSRLEVISPDAKTPAKLANQNRLLVRPEPDPQKRGGMVASLFSIVASTLVRGLVTYLGQKAGQSLSGQTLAGQTGPGEPHR